MGLVREVRILASSVVGESSIDVTERIPLPGPDSSYLARHFWVFIDERPTSMEIGTVSPEVGSPIMVALHNALRFYSRPLAYGKLPPASAVRSSIPVLGVIISKPINYAHAECEHSARVAAGREGGSEAGWRSLIDERSSEPTASLRASVKRWLERNSV